VKKSESGMQVRSEAVIQGVSYDKFVKALSDLRFEWDEKVKKTETLLETPEGKIIYLILNAPFPLSDRDAVVKLFRISNTANPDLVKKYGLPETKHRYFLILDESIEIEEKPKQKGKERASLNTFFYIEEIPDKKDSIKVRATLKNDMGGSIPDFLINNMSKQMPKKIFADLLEALPKLEKKGLL
jgi:hypothetical protein